MTMISLRQTLLANDHPMPWSAQGSLRYLMPWSAHRSLRRWASGLRVGWTPVSDLARIVFEAGFLYDPTQDIIYGRKDAWQHGYGYCYAYDKFAVAAGFVIDCEPIFFRHANKDWMIELWKGQYGIETGCEVGLYNRRDDDNGLDMQALDATIGRREDGRGGTDPVHSRFYKCVNQDEYLQIALRLRRDGTVLLERGPEPHWWLTGFKWGELSWPESLALEVCIRFIDPDMRDAFVASLRRMGYAGVRASGLSVDFVFDVPRTYQPRTAWGTMQNTAMATNGEIVRSYRALGLTSNDPNAIQGQVGARVAELAASMLSKGRDFYLSNLPDILEQVADEIADRVKDFFGIS